MKHTFDWQKEDRSYHDRSFLGWLLPHLFVFTDKDAMEKVSDKSNKFTEVEVGITLNGEPVDAKKFLEDLERVIMNQAHREAQEALRSLDYLDKMYEEVDRLTGYLKRGVDEAAETLGIEVSSWD